VDLNTRLSANRSWLRPPPWYSNCLLSREIATFTAKRNLSALYRFQRHCGAFSDPTDFQLVADLLALSQIADPRSLDRRYVDKHILRSVIGSDEPVAF
jgi:hypothetical protein